MEVQQQQYNPLKIALNAIRLLIGIATILIGTYAIKMLFPEINGVILTSIVIAVLCVVEPTKDYLSNCIYYELFTINVKRYVWIGILCVMLLAIIVASCYLNVLGVTHYQNTTPRHMVATSDTAARHDVSAIKSQIAGLNDQKQGIISTNGYRGKLGYNDPQKFNVARIDSTITGLMQSIINIENEAKSNANKQFEQQTAARNCMGLFLELATVVIILLKLYLSHIEQPEKPETQQPDAEQIKSDLLAELVALLQKNDNHDTPRHDASDNIERCDMAQEQDDMRQSDATNKKNTELTPKIIREVMDRRAQGVSWKGIAKEFGRSDNYWIRNVGKLIESNTEQTEKSQPNKA
jgi:hypothetical protein